MNGWERLGFVISLLIAIPTVLISHDGSAYVLHDPSMNITLAYGPDKEKDQTFWNLLYAEAAGANSILQSCDRPSIEMRWSYDNTYSISCDREPLTAWGEALGYGLIPFFIVWLIGLTIAWIRTGFKVSAK